MAVLGVYQPMLGFDNQVDTNRKFKDTFVGMVEYLNIIVHVAASRNHCTMGVEQPHKFLNHTITMYTKEHGTPEYFVKCGFSV